MISSKIKNIFLFSIPLFIAHGTEEYFTGFYKVDDIIFGHLRQEAAQPAFLTLQIIWWVMLIITGLKLITSKWAFRIMIFVGLVYIFEIHHLIHAFVLKAYYPGVITALVFPLVAFLFWKEMIRIYRN